ncbi:Non-ribosomal peptide synthetase C-terminal [Aureobasidium namibiae CBS 147.97]|uniref:Non-ribosomal peptide synthetase C-terminal n=1 Tax=Aureobasidium namibiae CBS 147.97 TaxID=1043004 RepID=A0A074WUN8_9PEZI
MAYSMPQTPDNYQTTDSRILIGDAPLDTEPIAPVSVTTLPQLFQHKARTQPESIAYSVQTDNGLQTITYAEADARASSLASCIATLSQRTEDDQAPTVAIWLEKGLDLVLAILATTYSGATWLPLDPDVPAERAAVCVVDASVSLIISDAAHADQVREVQERVASSTSADSISRLQCRTLTQLTLEVQSRVSQGLDASTLAPVLGPRPQDAAYLIYTSGTTGMPKGIAIPHSAALVFSLSEREVLETSPRDTVWNGFSPAFDMFVEEMWVTIAGGGHLAIGTRAECRDVPALPAVWAKRGVTVVNAVPTLIGIMNIARSDAGDSLLPSSIRLINLGGEACPPALVKSLAKPGLRIINTYGPTETTVTATWDELQPDVPVTIGKPLPGYHACLLPIFDDSSSATLAPLEWCEGVEGELAIGGPCVGLGYVGRPDLTSQKFLEHPLRSGTSEKLYRTGDRVRLQADRKIIFLGRIDTQVKHRGFRIELGEIESRLYDVPDVQAAAVILANAGSDNARLEAFVVLKDGAAHDIATIRQVAFESLPAYMRPEEVFFLESSEMPRLPSGKINGKALQEVSTRLHAERAAVRPSGDDTDISSVPSFVEMEGVLGLMLATLSPLFPGARVQPDSDIFTDLGGHSLIAAILISRLRQAKLDNDETRPFASIGLADIYELRTPASISSRFEISEKSKDLRLDLQEITSLDSDFEGTGPWTGEYLPVSQTKFVLCGIAQLLPLLFVFFLQSIEILVPYLLFDFHAVAGRIGFAILTAYAVFVVIPPALSIVAIAGKWLILGKARPGEYPLYGVYYFRWWFADRLVSLANPKLMADSGLYPIFLRACGAKVGKFCHLGALQIGPCADLVEIGDDVVIGGDVVLGACVVERGRLVLQRVVIENGASVGSRCVIEGGATVSEEAEVASLSLVPSGMIVPSFHRFHGSPARLDKVKKAEDSPRPQDTRPSKARATAMLLGNSVVAFLVLPLLYFVPQIPGLMLFDVLDIRSINGWQQTAILSVPIAFAYQILVFLQLLLYRHIFLGRLKEGTYSTYSVFYLRKWFIERLMDLALDVLHPVFATLYIVPFLRALGTKIGKRAEVSTARNVSFDLLEIGEESFVADAVIMGEGVVKGNKLTLQKTKLEPRAFAGNASVLPQGTTLASGTLLGVLSIAPPADTQMANNSSCFGSPPVLMPNRQRAEGHEDSLLFRPSAGRIAARLLIEGLRIVVPRSIIIFGLGFGLQLCHDGYAKIGAVYTLLMLPLLYLILFALPALLFTALIKWLLVGKYKPAEWPLWSLNVWLSEAVTSTWETLTEPLLAVHLVGTPYLAMCFRLMGVTIGSRVTFLSSDITEFDCVTLGDECIVNKTCGAQTHLFEDRVMKVGNVVLGNRACLKPFSVCLPGSTIEDEGQLGGLSLLMKGEVLPRGTAWEGAPVVPRARR